MSCVVFNTDLIVIVHESSRTASSPTVERDEVTKKGIVLRLPQGAILCGRNVSVEYFYNAWDARKIVNHATFQPRITKDLGYDG